MIKHGWTKILLEDPAGCLWSGEQQEGKQLFYLPPTPNYQEVKQVILIIHSYFPRALQIPKSGK